MDLNTAENSEQVAAPVPPAEAVEAQRVTEEPQGPENSPEPQNGRRVTRSQTGRAPKRPAEEAASAPKKKATPAKRAKRASRQNSAEQEPEEQEASQQPPPPSQTPTPAVSAGATPVPEAPGAPIVDDDAAAAIAAAAAAAHLEAQAQPSRITFLEVSTVNAESGERRMSRTRAFFPTPVPNLTKKSRGRRVPTTETVDPVAQPDKRYYVCKVEGCGKCFHRGEHLKRHIRSIHTHEKPFKCTYPQCEKFFNRHDNLLQHLKVHKEAKATRGSKSSGEGSRPTTPTSSGPIQGHEGFDSPASEGGPESPNMSARPRTIYDHQPALLYSGYANPAFDASMSMPTENRYVSNMAVSSLRTELPQSPTDSRPPPNPLQPTMNAPPMYPWHRATTEYPKDQLTGY